MNIKAQVAMVLNLDKCIGCHTCSVTCKNTWTNRPGAEYMWWNNVETRPGPGYPQQWEDQDRYQGGWVLDKEGRLRLRAGGAWSKLANIFGNPNLPTIDDYYEPWTYDYGALLNSPHRTHQPVARPRSMLTGEWMDAPVWGPNWDDDLAGGSEMAEQDPNVSRLAKVGEHIMFEYEQSFMMWLPRICEHCLNPSCVAACPSGAIYKRDEDGIVLVDQEACRGWRFCISGCPYKKMYFNWDSHKSEKCNFCYPRIEAGLPTVCSETCVGRIRYLGVLLYDADRVQAVASEPDPRNLYESQLSLFLDPHNPEVILAAQRAGINSAWITAAQASPISKLVLDWKIALPLHPEYRTLPMTWYVPSLSPMMNHIQNEPRLSAQGYFTALNQMRIPMNYLASLQTAGDVEAVHRALARLVAMRIHMRKQTVGDIDDTEACRIAELPEQEIEAMARLLGVAKYDERYVIPTGRREGDPFLEFEQGACSIEGVAPPEGRLPLVQLQTRRKEGR